MLNTFMEKVGGFLDQRFLIAYWMPALIALLLNIGLFIVRLGLTPIGKWWDGRTPTEQTLIGLGSLLAVSVVAYLLQALTIPLMRLYEGYWPYWVERYQRWAVAGQMRAKERASASARSRYYNYPQQAALLPTRFGNVMRATEEYPLRLYNMDAVIWWPRLVTRLPDGIRAQADDAFTPVVALLNLSTLLGLWALGGGLWIVLTDTRRWLFVAVFGIGLLLAWLCYQAAIAQSEIYGEQVRAAFDLHRHDLLQQLHIPIPNNLFAERIVWYKLGQLHYYGHLPWQYKLPAEDDPTDKPLPDDPLYYDSHKPDKPEPKPPAVDVNLQGLSTVILRQRGGL